MGAIPVGAGAASAQDCTAEGDAFDLDGEAVGVLLYDPKRDAVVLVRQQTWQVDLFREILVWGALTFMAIRFGFLSFIVAWTSLMLLNHFSLTPTGNK